MPVDPRHKRNLPAGSPLAKLLRRIWARQKQEAFQAVRHNQPLNLARWNQPLAELAQPHFLSYVGDGANDALKRIREAVRRGPRKQRRTRKDLLFGPSVGGEPATLAIGNDFDLFNPHVLAAIQRAVLAFADSTNATTMLSVNQAREEVRRLLGEGYTQGETITRLTRRINEIFDDRSRAWMIARTESSRAVHLGQVLAAKETGIIKGKQWLASADACEKCEALNGMIVGIDENFTIDMKGGPYAVIQFPPRHPHCVLPGTRVYAPAMIGAIRSNYDGPVVRIHFRSGSNVTVTPQHMFLAADGFITADGIVKGDHIFTCLNRKREFGSRPDKDGNPAIVDEIFESLSVSRRSRTCSRRCTSESLHGDAAFGDGYVDIVRPAGFLVNEIEYAEFIKNHYEFSFDSLNEFVGVPFNSKGTIAKVLECFRLATDGGMGRLRDELAKFRTALRVNESRGFALASDGDSRFLEACSYASPGDAIALSQSSFGLATEITLRHFLCNDRKSLRKRDGFFDSADRNSVLFQTALDSMAIGAKRLGYLRSRLSGLVTTDEVVDVERELWHTGHVYDLQTKSTMYIVQNGIISSNCRCTILDVIDWNAVGRQAA